MAQYINPIPQHFDANGDPLAGYTVYFGEPNVDPKAFPKAPYSDKGLTVLLPTAQVLSSTGAYGSDIYLDGAYSIRIETTLGSLWREIPSFSGIFNSSVIFGFTAVSMIADSSLDPGVFVQTIGYTTNGDGGDNYYEIEAAAAQVVDGGRYILLDNGNIAKGLFPGKLYNIKQWGAVGDGDGSGGGTDDTTAIQAAIDYVGALRGVLRAPDPAVAYLCDTGLVFDNIMKFEGDGDGTLFDFVNQPSGNAISVGTTVAPNGLILKDFRAVGSTSIDGLVINTVGAGINVARCHFENLDFEIFDTGLVTTYLTTSLFTNCEFGACNLGWEAGTQTNNIQVTRTNFTSCGVFATFQTCEGIQFDSPAFQNITDVAAEYALTLRQSSVTIDNPYFENIRGFGSNDADIALLGGGGDTIGCVFHVRGGIIQSGVNVFYREDLRHSIRVDGVRVAGTGRIGIASLGGNNNYLPFATLNNISDDVESLQGLTIERHQRNNLAFQGIDFTDATTRDLQVDHVLLSKVGGPVHNITGLNPGGAYTIIVAMRREAAGSLTLRWKLASSTVQTTTATTMIPLNSEKFELRYLPIFAPGDELDFIFSDHDWQLRLVAIVGNHVFPEIDTLIDMPLYNDETPTGSGFSVGTQVLERLPVLAAPQGWRLTAGGWEDMPDL
jgi:hypothetical protein